MSGERTEKATPKRREDALKRGQIARGAKLPAALGFLAGMAVLHATGEDWIGRAGHLVASLSQRATSAESLTPSVVHNIFIDSAATLALLSLPAMSAALLGGVLGNFVQGGFVLTPGAFSSFKDRFNPVNNLKRIFSSQSIMELLKSLLELVCLTAACWGIIEKTVLEAPAIIGAPAVQALIAIGVLVYALSLRVCGVLLLFALVDYGYKRYMHEKSLRMTKQEIKEEFKQQEGDPMIKHQRRRAARALLQRKIAVEVPLSDVVITNPTHFAVALRYDRMNSPAPIVTVKGADLMAKQIRKLAEESDVAIVENPPLARSLYKSVEPGQAVPPEFFRAVAEVLAYVYKKRGGL